MTNLDENFKSISKLENHIASFTANLENGSLLDSTQDATQEEATAAYKLLQNVSLLLAKQKVPKSSKSDIGTEEMEEEKKQNEDDSLDILNRVTVSLKNCNYVFTISDDKIYGIKRANKENKE